MSSGYYRRTDLLSLISLDVTDQHVFSSSHALIKIILLADTKKETLSDSFLPVCEVASLSPLRHTGIKGISQTVPHQIESKHTKNYSQSWKNG